jgi:hypothetical protein
VRSKPPEGIAIVVPAHDEAALVRGCLGAIRATIARPRIPVAVVLVAHRCSDATEMIAREELSGLPGLGEGIVLRLDRGNVATARSAGAMAGLHLLSAYGVRFENTWLLSTDADSRVPKDWIEEFRRRMVADTAAITGLVRVDGWEDGRPAVAPQISEAYHRIIAAGLHNDSHDHVYAANLAVRADAYLEAGGWPDQVPGEDAALLDALRRRGRTVVSAPEIVVRTSGRVVPRAPGGLGALLGRLAAAPLEPSSQVGQIIPRQALRSPA